MRRNSSNNRNRRNDNRQRQRRVNPQQLQRQNEVQEARRNESNAMLWLRPSEYRKIANYSPMQTLTIRRQTNLTPIVTSTTIDVNGAYAFTLSQLPTSSDFTALFDSYRIIGVRLTFLSRPTEAGIGSTVNPLLYVALDTDDATPVSINLLQQYDSVVVRRSVSDRPFSVVVKPHVATGIYDGSLIAPAGDVADQWLDCGSTTIPHYGVKYAIQPSSAGVGAITIDVVADFYMQFRHLR